MDKNSDKILKLKQNLRALKPRDAPPQYAALKKPHPNKSNKAFYILHRLKPE